MKTFPQSLPARVLVTEDDPVNLRVALKLLEKLGVSADGATSGEEALGALRTTKYDLLLLDCQMPGLDGYEVARRVRNSAPEPFAAITIVAFTAHAVPGDRERCIAAGMNDYLRKPARSDALASMLAKWLADTLVK